MYVEKKVGSLAIGVQGGGVKLYAIDPLGLVRLEFLTICDDGFLPRIRRGSYSEKQVRIRAVLNLSANAMTTFV